MSFVLVRGLQKSFGALPAVRGIDFEIHEGEVFSLLGPNGAGKSTTIEMLATLIEPSGGDAWIDGMSIRGKSKKLRSICGLVPQEIALYEELSGRDNLLFWGRLYGLAGRELRRRVKTVLERVGLAERSDKAIKSYSGGMKRRINIAASLIHRPRLLFMDEPTVGIDPQSRRAMLDLILDLKAEGTTILYTTHYMAEAEELSDRVGIIDGGRLLAVGTCQELAASIGGNEQLRLAFGAETDGRRLGDRLVAIPGIKVESAGATLTISAPRVRELLPRIIEIAGGVRALFRDIEVRRPDLETVFLAYTGRNLEGGGT